MTLKINEIEKKYVSKEITYCCEDIKIAHENGPLRIVIINNNKIEATITNSYYVAYIKYCPFCGEKINE